MPLYFYAIGRLWLLQVLVFIVLCILSITTCFCSLTSSTFILTFVDHLCYLCLVIAIFSRLFIVALWSPAGIGLTSWLLIEMFNCVLSLSHVVSWVR